MRQSFKNLAKEDWKKKKLYYEALIRTDSYCRLVDSAFTEWAAEEKLDLNQCELTKEKDRFFSTSYQAIILAKKLKIPYLLDPDTEFPEVAVSRTSVRTIRRQASKFFIEETTPLDPGIKLRPIGSKTSPSSKKEFVPLKPHKKDGRYLLAEIDLHAPKERILAEIEFTINIHKFTVKSSPPKKKVHVLSKHKHSPFAIYDMAKAGKSLLQITWELFPEVNGINPNYDENAKKHYEEVRRLHLKAATLIKEAEESIPKSLKPRLRRSVNVKKDPNPA